MGREELRTACKKIPLSKREAVKKSKKGCHSYITMI
jgi:hypothetical protein